MNTNQVEESVMHENEDDLTAIKGVGRGYANALNRIGIRRYADFRDYVTNSDLHQALAQAGESIPVWKITRDDWVGSAMLLAGVEEEATPPSAAPPSAAESEPARESHRHASTAGWTQYAGFNVYFEYGQEVAAGRNWHTVVYKSLEPDSFNDKRIFEGIDPAVWAEWIMDRAELPPDAGPVLPAAAPPAPVESRVDITDIHVSMLPPSAGFPEKRLNAAVKFRLPGEEGGASTAEDEPFRVEIHTVNVETGELNLVASGQGQFQPDAVEYTSHQAFALPEVGRYEVYGLVLLLPPAGMAACRQGPTIRIVP